MMVSTIYLRFQQVMIVISLVGTVLYAHVAPIHMNYVLGHPTPQPLRPMQS